MNKSILFQSDYILITDIGSTTTKALLLQKKRGSEKYFFAGQCDAYTTVEEPYENVNIGLINAAKKMEKLTSVAILDEKNNFKIPYLTTSSAAGGLQMLVLGLTPSDSGKIAKMTALSAGGVVLQDLFFTDKIPETEKIRIIKESSPDMILMAGGYEGGMNYGVVRLCHLLNLAEPVPKYMPNLQIPLVFCGNTKLTTYVKDILEDKFELFFTPNVRPDKNQLNIEPTKEVVHTLFKDKVMQRAPGYPELMTKVADQIQPTPVAVEKILSLYTAKNKENIVVVDMGGSTTDIYSFAEGAFHRTVAANVGLSYSMANILALILEDRGFNKILQYLPDSFTENDVRDYIYNKTLNPAYLPRNESEVVVEQACAIIGFNISWAQHIEMNFKIIIEDFFDDTENWLLNMLIPVRDAVKKILFGRCYEEQLFPVGDNPKFSLSKIDNIIGSGGVIAYAASNEEQILMLLEGFKPYGVTKLIVDKPFKISHMGILAEQDPDLALNLFEEQCLVDLAMVIAPFGAVYAGKTVLHIACNGTTESVKGGEFRYFPQGGDFKFTTPPEIYIKRKVRDFSLNTRLPVIVDCRGRDRFFINTALSGSGIAAFAKKQTRFLSQIPVPQIAPADCTPKTLLTTRQLPYEGVLSSAIGDLVTPDQKIGYNSFRPPRQLYIDIRNSIDFDKRVTKEDLISGIQVKKGQMVKKGDLLWSKNLDKAKWEVNALTGKATGGKQLTVNSVYNGEIVNVHKNGMIIVKEMQEYYTEPVTLTIAGPIGINASEIEFYLQYKIGELVEQGRAIAENPRSIYQRFIFAEKCGYLKAIDKKQGTVTLHFDKKPVAKSAWVNGRVKSLVDKKSVVIESCSSQINGIIGFGGENFGELAVISQKPLALALMKDKIICTAFSLDLPFLQAAVKAGIKGIIAPSIKSSDWVLFSGKEMGVALTGDEDLLFTLVILKGFGEYLMDNELLNFFISNQGKTVSLSGRTQIRAGVTRPVVLISS